MKRIIALLVLLSFSTLNAQYSKGKIQLKNGAYLDGFLLIEDQHIVKFKPNRKDTPVSYDHETIKSVSIHNTKYQYVQSSNHPTPKLLSEIIPGKIKLYGFISITYGGYSHTGATALGPQRIPYYYVYVKDSLIGIGSKFKKKQFDIFKDCFLLMEKIQNKEFKKWDVYDIVEFYNYDCQP